MSGLSFIVVIKLDARHSRCRGGLVVSGALRIGKDEQADFMRLDALGDEVAKPLGDRIDFGRFVEVELHDWGR